VIIDTSALVAILRGENERANFLEIIGHASDRCISAASYLELGIVLDNRHDPSAARGLDDLLATLDIDIAEVTARQARLARSAYRDFGRGSGHPAKLNFGDCFSYALAKDTDEPLLWKGEDFGHTDVRRPEPTTGS